MKWIAMLVCLMLLAGCAGAAEETTAPTETEPAETVMEIPETVLSHEIAMLEGYVVMDEGDVRHNAGNWLAFLEESEAGNPAAVTVVDFTLEESGYTYVKYDLSFDGSMYAVEYEKDGETFIDSASQLDHAREDLEDTAEPYDSYEQYSLNGLVLYKDLIAEPDFEGVTEIFLHAKEGEPAISTYTGESLQGILELLWTAEYVPCEPDNYVYGMKLLMTNRDGQELVIELDLNQGYYRYGMQNYHYGEVADMLAVLNLDQWPDSVLNEYAAYLE